MNEQLQAKLVEILSGIQSATKAAGDFAMEQLPDIAQQYVVYGRVYETLSFAASVFIVGLCVFVAIKYGYGNKSAVHTGGYDEGEWHGSRLFAAAGGTLGGALVLPAIFINGNSAALVWFAPKVWLLKELASLIK